jgi:hypothetical protein
VSFSSSTGRYRSDGLGPVTRVAGAHELERRESRSGRVGTGTLACSRCDAPVSIGGRVVLPTDPLRCPFCDHRAPAKDFLSMARPARPARVTVRVSRIAPRPAG